MRVDRLDLNLLRIVVALHDQRSVSAAAQSLAMSQPAVSTALARLRSFFGDALFVRTARGMEPTSRANALIAPAREILQRVESDVLTTASFDPGSTEETFTVALSDVGEIVFLPRILEYFARHAPFACVRSVTMPAAQVEAGLACGEIDLAIGYFPDLKKRNFFQQRLFTHHFVCLVGASHPARGRSLSMEDFLLYGHAVVRAEGRSQELFERCLEREKIQRRVVLYTPHFMSIPFILARTDLIATVPHAVGISFAQANTGIRVLKPPMPLPQFDLKQHWHRKFHDDSRLQWFRTRIGELFNDGADEWRDEGEKSNPVSR